MQCANWHDPHDRTKPKMVSRRIREREVLPVVPHGEAWPVPSGSTPRCREPYAPAMTPTGRTTRTPRRKAALSLPAGLRHLNTRHPGSLYDGTNTLAGRSCPTARSSTRARTVIRTSTAATRRPDGIPGEVAMKRTLWVIVALGLPFPSPAREPCEAGGPSRSGGGRTRGGRRAAPDAADGAGVPAAAPRLRVAGGVEDRHQLVACSSDTATSPRASSSPSRALPGTRCSPTT